MRLQRCRVAQDDKGIWHLSDVNGFPAVCGGAAGGKFAGQSRFIGGASGPNGGKGPITRLLSTPGPYGLS